MNTPVPARDDAIRNILAAELFKRTAGSTAVGVLGVGILLYVHWKAIPAQHSIPWASVMLAVFAGRIIAAHRGLTITDQGHDPVPTVNLLAFLGALTGLGWSTALYVFDTKTVDLNFNLRLIIIVAALTFPISSLAAFKRVFFSFFLAISIPVLVYIGTSDYLHDWQVLVSSGVIYMLMISILALNANRHIKLAAVNNIEILNLNEKLQQALEAETQLRTELSVRAETDYLTGIFNRGGLMTQLNIELARCRRFPRSTAVLMIDIDHFKQVNDTYGHGAGDIAILAVVDTVNKQLRATDILGRLGGEEFLVILPDMETEGALAAAERIRAAIEQAPVALPDAFTQTTVSIGVTAYAREDDADRILTRADRALYVAKDNGRNRVEIEF